MTIENPVRVALGRPLRLGVVGGGAGSFIGPVHRRAAVFDDRFEIVASVLSSKLDKAVVQGVDLGLDPARSYSTIDEMLKTEAARPGSDGIEAVAIMTPNDCHFAQCVAALQAGLHVICDKPLANDVDDARQLVALVEKSGLAFCLTHNYSGYPMVRQARAMVGDGALGTIRVIHAEYFQAGMARRVEDGTLTDKLRWKLDTSRSGPSLVLGDIGTHAHQLACFVGMSPVAEVCAEVGALVPNRAVDDYAAMLWRFRNGARGSCMVTQAAAGTENNVKVRIYGDLGMLEWEHASPNYLKHAPLGDSVRTMGRGDPYLHPDSLAASRFTRGHPEGFIEAFANLYADFSARILAKMSGKGEDALYPGLPGVEDGLRGLEFVAAALESSRTRSWVRC